jgi:hypothetical protein
MLNTVQTYTDTITSEHADKPKFIATVAFDVEFYVYMQGLLDSMSAEGGIFDLSTPPVGEQEDFIGELVGVSRNITEPITGVYFSWDGTDASVGWDSGVWQPENQPVSLVTLPDDVYLTVILAKIAANNWDGTTEGAYLVWDILFPNLTLLIMDAQNMSYTVALQGELVDALTQALLTQGYLPLKPEGIQVTKYIVSADSNPLFAWDVATPNMAGWDIGSWGIELPGA